MTLSSCRTATSTVCASFSKSKLAPVTWRAKFTDPKLHTAVSPRTDLDDFRAEVRKMDDGAGLPGLVAGPIGFVLEGHPAVAGLRERTHHSSIQIPRGQRLARQTPRFGLGISMLEILSVHIRQFGNVLWIEKRPILVGLDSPHE